MPGRRCAAALARSLNSVIRLAFAVLRLVRLRHGSRVPDESMLLFSEVTLCGRPAEGTDQIRAEIHSKGSTQALGCSRAGLRGGDRLGVSELPPARVGRWVFAEAERDLISESTREGLARAKSSGSSP